MKWTDLEQKNITFIGLNYAPEDSAIGLYSTQWVEYLKEKGCNVSVITAFPYYPQWEISKDYKSKPTFLIEDNNGVKVFRYKLYVPKTPTFLKRIIHLIVKQWTQKKCMKSCYINVMV